MNIWLYTRKLIAGDSWQKETEKALAQSKSCVAFIGTYGIGPWQDEEMQMAWVQCVSKKSMRVVPALLPDAAREEKESELPPLLQLRHWVKFPLEEMSFALYRL